MSPFHLASYVGVLAGFSVIASAWRTLHSAQRSGALASTGLYAWARHPQYLGLMLIMVGFLLQWPTIPTLVMFPIFVLVYWRLASREERAVREQFEAAWDEYAARVPRFVPRRPSARPVAAGSG